MSRQQPRIIRAGGGGGGGAFDGGIVTQQMIWKDGTVAAPSTGFATATTTGFFKGASTNNVEMTFGGTWRVGFFSSGLAVANNGGLHWTNGLSSGVKLLSLVYGGTEGIMEQKLTTTAQEFRIYETFTDASNYARLTLRTAAGNYTITPEAAGTGTLRDLTIGATAVDTFFPGGVVMGNGTKPARDELHLQAADPRVVYEDASLNAAERVWFAGMDNVNKFRIGTLTDAYGSGINAISIRRSGTTILDFAMFSNGSLSLTGASTITLTVPTVEIASVGGNLTMRGRTFLNVSGGGVDTANIAAHVSLTTINLGLSGAVVNVPGVLIVTGNIASLGTQISLGNATNPKLVITDTGASEMIVQALGTTAGIVGTTTAHDLQLFTNNTSRLTITQGTGLVKVLNAFTVAGNAICEADFSVEGDFVSELASTSLADSTSAGTGAIHTDGGLGVAKNLFIGTDLIVTRNSGFGLAVTTTTFAGFGAATTAKSSLRVPHGVAPSSPVNGDVWTTTAGLFVRVNGTTVGPLT